MTLVIIVLSKTEFQIEVNDQVGINLFTKQLCLGNLSFKFSQHVQ